MTPDLSDEDWAKLNSLRRELHEAQAMLLAIKNRLGGYHARKTELQTAIAETHADTVEAPVESVIGSRVAVLNYVRNPAATAERAPFFVMLDQLNKDNAPLNEERRVWALRVKNLMAVIEMISDPKPLRRRRKRASGQ